MPRDSEKRQYAPVTLGTVVDQRSFAWFRITQARLSPGRRLPQHVHEYPRLTIVRRGGFDLHQGRESLSLDSDGVYFKPAERPHGSTIGIAGLQSLIIEIRTDRLESSLCERFRLPDRGLRWGDATVASLAGAIEREYDVTDIPSGLALEGLILELVASLLRTPSPAREPQAPPWLRRADALLRANFARNLTLSEIAQEVGVHPSHLARSFRAHYGRSIGDTVRRLRLRHATRRLVSSEEPISEIASACGFFDQAHMTRWFRRYFETTPACVRAGARRGTGRPSGG